MSIPADVLMKATAVLFNKQTPENLADLSYSTFHEAAQLIWNAAVEASCKAVCSYCAEGTPAEHYSNPNDSWYSHKIEGEWYYCDASAVRAMSQEG